MVKYRDLLIEKYGYSEFEAEITDQDLQAVDEETAEKLALFLDGADVSDYHCGEYSVKKLVEQFGLTPIAALLSIFQLKKDYDGMQRVLMSKK